MVNGKPGAVLMSKVRSIIALIVTAPALFGTFYGLGPELMRDIRLRNEPFTPAINAKIEEAKCTNVWFVLAHCTVKYVLNQSPRSTATDLNFAFFGRAGGTVRLLHAASDSAIVAT